MWGGGGVWFGYILAEVPLQDGKVGRYHMDTRCQTVPWSGSGERQHLGQSGCP